MKRGLCLVATVTLSSALYAQQTLTRQSVADIFTQYNPQLMSSQQAPQMKAWVDRLIYSYTAQQLPDTLENRYTLIALARNFENSLLLDALTRQYQHALLYARMGNSAVSVSAQQFAEQTLPKIYARIWAVSVQVKEDLLKQYQQQLHALAADTTLTSSQKQALKTRYQHAITLLRQDLRQLKTNPGKQLQELSRQTLLASQQKVQETLSELQNEQSSNLQIKTKHKKPVAK